MNKRPVDYADAATLPVNNLRGMLKSMRSLCRANDAAANLHVADFGNIVQGLAERGIALCDEAIERIIALDDKKVPKVNRG